MQTQGAGRITIPNELQGFLSIGAFFAIVAAILTVLVTVVTFMQTGNGMLFHPATLGPAFLRAMVVSAVLLVGCVALVGLTRKWNPYFFWIPLLIACGWLDQKLLLGQLLFGDMAAPASDHRSFALVVAVGVIGGVLHVRAQKKEVTSG